MRDLARLWTYARRYRGRYAGGLLLVMFATLTGAAVPLLIKEAIDGLGRGESQSVIIRAAVTIVLLALLRSLFVFAGRLLLLTTARRIEYDLRNDLYARLMRLPASFFDARTTGDLSSRAINDIEGIRTLIGIGLMSLVGTGLMFLACTGGMFLLDWKLALLSLIPLSLVTVVTAATGPAMHRRSTAVQDQLGVLSARAQENFSGARIIRAFAQEDHEIARYRDECELYLRRNLSLASLRGATFALIALFTELAIAVTLYVGGGGMIEGRLTWGHLAAFTAYQFMIIWPMIAIGWVISLFQRGAACTRRLLEIIDSPEAEQGGCAHDADLAGRIEFRGLTFRYDERRDPALQDVSFTVEPGRKVAIVGPTGSGKSTLATLLLRFHAAPPGTLFIDGHDIGTIPARTVRRAVGLVPQDPFLFSDTLRSNIAFGSLDDVDPDIDGAARISRIAADAGRFPAGLDQVIGERGVTLSGGQKQRTAIARALVRRPSILILDDALSSVDAQTEREILTDLKPVMDGRTTLVITHRLSAIRDADLIVVLDRGRVAESGTHGELLKKPGLYARLWERQQLAASLTSGS